MKAQRASGKGLAPYQHAHAYHEWDPRGGVSGETH
ncbi:hypothetical protein PENANT_c168G06409 [Penicillium antarcticum]|uniref:Uncharacterized protein n=1 Tax=Penicillium antarcticum TaxID=416450 RepID=A0A1V6PCC4_9EURO|nr:hypothetical protein PENANT_c168G06409 [Penicillium antarcticum]